MITSLPWLRAAVTACLMLALGMAMHVAAGGPVHAPSVGSVAILPLALLSVRLLQGRPGSAGRSAGLLLLGQAAVHVALNPAGHCGGGQVGHPLTAGSMAHSDMLRRAGEAHGPQILAAAADSLSCLLADPGMLVAHAAAAAGLGWWLAAGERLWSRAMDTLAGLPRSLWSAALSALGPQVTRLKSSCPRIDIAPAHRTCRLFLVAGTLRRGPPALG